MSLAPGFSRRSTHLLCPSGVGVKFEKAREWSTPVIGLGWLEEVARTGTIPAANVFLVTSEVEKQVVPKMDVDVDLYGETARETNGKGKGKADQRESTVNGVDCYYISPHRFNLMRFLDEPTSWSRLNTPPLSQEESADRQSMSLQTELSFGDTNGILGRPQSTQSLSQRSLSSIGAAKPARSRPPPQDSSTETDASISSGAEPRKPTPLEVERERNQARIPSSKSPSPLKIPNAPTSPMKKALERRRTRMLSVSPTKLTREASKALRDNITSLLGKRQPSTEDEEAMNSRAGKRPRPQRSKVSF